jgi:hypothetical protein
VETDEPWISPAAAGTVAAEVVHELRSLGRDHEPSA